MHNISGKLVHSNGTDGSKSRVRLSTTPSAHGLQTTTYSAEALTFPYLIPFFAQYFSPLKIVLPPPVEHYFYPVSTAPINNKTKGK
jgi:hypothetical protein